MNDTILLTLIIRLQAQILQLEELNRGQAEQIKKQEEAITKGDTLIKTLQDQIKVQQS